MGFWSRNFPLFNYINLITYLRILCWNSFSNPWLLCSDLGGWSTTNRSVTNNWIECNQTLPIGFLLLVRDFLKPSKKWKTSYLPLQEYIPRTKQWQGMVKPGLQSWWSCCKQFLVIIRTLGEQPTVKSSSNDWKSFIIIIILTNFCP